MPKGANRGHWGVEIMHRNKDVILGEDGYTTRGGNAPRKIFPSSGFRTTEIRLFAYFQDEPFAFTESP